MDPTNPVEGQQPVVQEQETPDKSNVQKRIDELTAEKYAYAKQVEQLTSTVADLIKSTQAQQQQQVQHVSEPQLPEGVDPGVAKFFLTQMQEMQKKSQEATEQMYWRMQHQLDQTQVASRYGNLPPEVMQDAARRLTGLKRQYGEAATMDDAVKIALGEYALKQAQNGQRQAYNQMNQPMNIQSSMPNIGGQQQQSTTLAPPTHLPNWDSLDHVTQNKLIDEYEKKGGRLL